MEPQNVIIVLGVSQNISVSGEGGTISTSKPKLNFLPLGKASDKKSPLPLALVNIMASNNITLCFKENDLNHPPPLCYSR